MPKSRRRARNGGKVRAVIDVNVLIAGLLWHGPPHSLLTRMRGAALGLVSSPALLAELDGVLGRPKFDLALARSNTSREQALSELRQLAYETAEDEVSTTSYVYNTWQAR